MSRRKDVARCCRYVRELVEESKYTKALEVMEDIPFEEIEAVADLKLFASMYEKAERFNEVKAIYDHIYMRNQSKHNLYQLIQLLIRFGDFEEAREHFLIYEIMGNVTLDTYILRYNLALAEGEPREKLIEILEDLRKEEFNEQWGYQLAVLYEMEGRREDCIEVCDDLILWFVEGSIVEKAKALKERCEADDWEKPEDVEVPNLVEKDELEIVTYAAAPMQVEELVTKEEQEEESEDAEDKKEDNDESVQQTDDTAEDVKDEPVSEPVDTIVDESVSELVDTIVDESVSEPVDTIIDESVSEPVDTIVDESVSGELDSALEKAIEDSTEEVIAESLDELLKKTKPKITPKKPKVDVVPPADKPVEEPAVEEEPEVVANDIVGLEGVGEVKPSSPEDEQKRKEMKAKLDAEAEVMQPTREVSEVFATPKERLEELAKEREEVLKRKVAPVEEVLTKEEATWSEEPADTSAKGIKYRTIKTAVFHVKREKDVANFVIAGGEEKMEIAVAKRLAKELNHVGHLHAVGLAKISAEDFNDVEIFSEDYRDKGRCLAITSASELSEKSVNDVIKLIKDNGTNGVVMLLGPFDEIDCFLAMYPELSELLNYKVKL